MRKGIYKFQLTAEKIADRKEKYSIKNPSRAVEFLRKRAGNLLVQEKFWVIALSEANKIIGFAELCKGGVSHSTVDVKLIFSFLLQIPSCTSFIAVHNHPSGNVRPSVNDEKLTERIKQAAEIMGFRFLDHIIISGQLPLPHGRGLRK